MQSWLSSILNGRYSVSLCLFCSTHTRLHACSVAQSYLTLCDPMDCSPPGSSRQEYWNWVTISSSKGSSWPRDWMHIRCLLHLQNLQADSLPLSHLGSLLPHTWEPLQILAYPTKWSICSPSMGLHWYIIITPSLEFTSRLTFGVIHSMDLDKWIMTCIHHYQIQCIFNVLKVFCILHIYLLHSQCLEFTFFFFSVSMVLPDLGNIKVGVIQNVIFSDWHLSCNNKHLSFLQVFVQLKSSFLFSAE